MQHDVQPGVSLSSGLAQDFADAGEAIANPGVGESSLTGVVAVVNFHRDELVPLIDVDRAEGTVRGVIGEQPGDLIFFARGGEASYLKDQVGKLVVAVVPKDFLDDLHEDHLRFSVAPGLLSSSHGLGDRAVEDGRGGRGGHDGLRRVPEATRSRK